MYEYNAKIDYSSRYPQGAYDGDTIDFVIDLGFGISVARRVRLLGVDCQELRGDSREEGLFFRNLTREWLYQGDTQDWAFRIHTEKHDSFGRYLAIVIRNNDASVLNQYLLDNGGPPYET